MLRTVEQVVVGDGLTTLTMTGLYPSIAYTVEVGNGLLVQRV